MDINYRTQIIDTIDILLESREIIFTQIINLAMSNEYSSFEEVFKEGDIYEFSMEHFENMDDINIQKLIKLCKKTEKTINVLMNLNGIKIEEVNFYGKDEDEE